ncbi:MAG: Tetratricopeptide domain protein [Pedosphaera sp.]|nr:Tetratricopeptide domain protein [Pedosphaera sp.]
MNRYFNSWLSRWWLMLALGLMLLSGNSLQAASEAEKRAFDAAYKIFKDGGLGYERAEKDFAQFIKDYPSSERHADAIFWEAQARFQQKKYAGAIELLSAEQAHAGKLADQYLYRIAEAHFYNTNYQSAAETFARLIKEYPASAVRPKAILDESEAHARLGDWATVTNRLQQAEGAFQQMAKSNPTNESVIQGFLLLGQAELALKDYHGAEQTVQELAKLQLQPDLEWRRQHLLCRVKLEAGHPEEAMQNSTNLVVAGKMEQQAQGVIFQAQILERLNRLPEAVGVYETNLVAKEWPVDLRRQALFKVVDLTLKQGNTDLAAQKLEDFLTKYPTEKTSDLAVLTLGEIQLRQYYKLLENNSKLENPLTLATATNLLQRAEGRFNALITTYTNSEYVGKAQLNLGWCLWSEGKIPESQAAFSNAVMKLPLGEDQAVARFKLGDIQFQQKDYAGAVTNYNLVVSQYGAFASVKENLLEQALYQTVRAGLEQTNPAVATNAMSQILKSFPNSLLADPSMLLVGQGLNFQESSAKAREVFSGLLARSPESPLLPEVKLAIARTYEKEGNWPAAITNYDIWVMSYASSPTMPQAEFSRAWANFRAGRETNAFSLFTNFVVKFQANGLAPKAQYWIGDFHWQHEDFQNAERSYQEVFQKWPTATNLTYRAIMMAGRAAVGRGAPGEAIDFYFTKLTGDSNCPPNLAAEALYAYGDAEISLASSKSSLTNIMEAIGIFEKITNRYPTNVLAPLALARMGDCWLQLAAKDPTQYESVTNAYVRATNVYQRVIDSPLADIATRSMAEVGLGKVLEKMAGLAKTSDEQKQLFRDALDRYSNVFYYEKNLRDGEKQDSFWLKEAGLNAGRLAEELGQGEQAVNVYTRLGNEIPPLKQALVKRIEKARENVAKEKN